MKARELIKTVERDGWVLNRIQGSHYVYKHPTKRGRVVIPLHGLNHDVPIGTMLSVLKQAGLR
jgi:predicted RNA binding protein YcfA (HicA-like mRNA interferase family)